MSAEAKELIRKVQPHETGDNTLWLIHQLDIEDKHKLMIPAIVAFRNIGVSAIRGYTNWFGREHVSFPLESGYEIVSLPTSTYQREDHDCFKLAVDITFDESEITGPAPVLETLKHMADFVDSFVGEFERLLP